MGVVVVSIQYRLGPLGFLCLGTPGIPGNQGLMDQVEALNWIRRNIIYFGGNPEQYVLYAVFMLVFHVVSHLHLLPRVNNINNAIFSVSYEQISLA